MSGILLPKAHQPHEGHQSNKDEVHTVADQASCSVRIPAWKEWDPYSLTVHWVYR